MQILRQRRKLGTEIEELMLHPAEDMPQLAEPHRRCAVSSPQVTASQPDEGIQLVHGAVGFDARGIFRDSLPSCQGGFALVATLGVDPVERDARVIERFVRHAFMLALGLTVGYLR